MSKSYERPSVDETLTIRIYDVPTQKYIYNPTEKQLEERGFFKKMTLRILGGKRVFWQPIPNSTVMQKKELWVLQTFEVSVQDCLFCQKMKKEMKGYLGYDFLMRQSVKTACFQTCFATGMTSLISDTDNKDRWHLISEKPIESLNEIIDLYQKGMIDHISDSGLWKIIERRLGGSDFSL